MHHFIATLQRAILFEWLAEKRIITLGDLDQDPKVLKGTRRRAVKLHQPIPIPSKMRFVSAALAILFAASPAFAATCTVSTSGDAAEAIESAFKQCASGGTVVFTKGATYNMKSVVSVTDVKNVKVQFEGTVNLPAYNEDFEDEKAFFYIEGDNITWKGSGVFNGNGQGW